MLVTAFFSGYLITHVLVIIPYSVTRKRASSSTGLLDALFRVTEYGMKTHNFQSSFFCVHSSFFGDLETFNFESSFFGDLEVFVIYLFKTFRIHFRRYFSLVFRFSFPIP